LQSYNRLTIQVNLKGAEPMNYQLVERKGFQIVGVKERFNCDGDLGLSLDIGHFWTKVGKNGTINRLLGLNNGQISGLIGASVDYRKRTMRLSIGWALNTKETYLMDYLVIKYLPKNGRYLKPWGP